MKALIKLEFSNLKNQPEGTSLEYRGDSVDGDLSSLRWVAISWDGVVIGQALSDRCRQLLVSQ